MKSSKDIAKEIISIAISHNNKKLYSHNPISFLDCNCIAEVAEIIDQHIKEILLETKNEKKQNV